MLSAFIPSVLRYPAMPLAKQLVHNWYSGDFIHRPFRLFPCFPSDFSTRLSCNSFLHFTVSPHRCYFSCRPPVSSSAVPLAFALGSGYLAVRCTLKTEHCHFILQSLKDFSLSLRFGQAFGLLVSVSYTHYCASTSDLSTT